MKNKLRKFLENNLENKKQWAKISQEDLEFAQELLDLEEYERTHKS